MRCIVLFFLLSGMLSACGEKGVDTNTGISEQLQIMTTIKPVQAIVAAIVNNTGNSF